MATNSLAFFFGSPWVHHLARLPTFNISTSPSSVRPQLESIFRPPLRGLYSCFIQWLASFAFLVSFVSQAINFFLGACVQLFLGLPPVAVATGRRHPSNGCRARSVSHF
ncbi:hypothetical protein B0H17DRAFT_1067122 [Mycena rosella]|uniref:Uncharacterized protein n=1 Tax=Mycena rosella TaxID=1033263 RepID=A0AAD7DGS0_MYCRO|nr:hypothetical protein B0H17DRAFT_1067122 [Mycena rosella]